MGASAWPTYGVISTTVVKGRQKRRLVRAPSWPATTSEALAKRRTCSTSASDATVPPVTTTVLQPRSPSASRSAASLLELPRSSSRWWRKMAGPAEEEAISRETNRPDRAGALIPSRSRPATLATSRRANLQGRSARQQSRYDRAEPHRSCARWRIAAVRSAMASQRLNHATETLLPLPTRRPLPNVSEGPSQICTGSTSSTLATIRVLGTPARVTQRCGVAASWAAIGTSSANTVW
mmetsp:Transcript_15869/g.50679  ORF Transcript_15869/g.50679 Transcript_15869/m.50679 type:complete len:237 (-) Transcript_15869:128-838(-)